MAIYLRDIVLEKYHERFKKKIWRDVLDRSTLILGKLFKQWGEKNDPVPRTVLWFEVKKSKEFKKLEFPSRTFSNDIKRLKNDLHLIVKIKGRGYKPSDDLIDKWRNNQ